MTAADPKVTIIASMGTCQLCGASRLVVNNQIAAHNSIKLLGTCPGSNQPPYEASNSLIDGHIAGLQRRINATEHRAIDVERGLTVVWVHEFVPHRKVRGHRVAAHWTWRSIPVKDLLEIGPQTRWIGLDGREKSCNAYAIADDDGYVRALNGIKANDLRRDNLTLIKYIKWLYERRNKWVSPL